MKGKVNIISTDSIYPGEASAIGIRAYQLYKLFKDNDIETCLFVPEINFDDNKNKEGDKIGIFCTKVSEGTDYAWTVPSKVTILPINAFSHALKYDNFILDGFSPIMVEELYLNLSKEESKLRKLQIELMLNKCKAIICATPSQKAYYIGLLSAYGLEKPLLYVPLYLPISEKKRFVYKKNKIILSYGGVYPWMDLERMLQLFSEFPKEYKLLFKGVQHPRYKRDKGSKILQKALEKFPKLKKRVIIDKSWNEELIEVECGIFLGKEPERSISYRTRAFDLMSQGVPMILDEEEYAWEVSHGLAVASGIGVKSIINLVNNYINNIEEYKFNLNSSFSFDYVGICLIEYLHYFE